MYNLLEQLYANGTIEHKIIAFYINSNQILNGAVSIGAWDYNGIEGNSNCTVSIGAWDNNGIEENNNCTDPNNDK